MLKKYFITFQFKGWVSRVTWCSGSENLFVTASHDSLVKMWDARSFRTPLYDLTGSYEIFTFTIFSSKLLVPLDYPV